MAELMCRNCINCVLIFFNILALLASFAMTIIGAIVAWNKELVKSVIAPYLKTLGSGPVPLTEKQVQEMAEEVHNLIGPLGYAPFIFGFFIFIASLLAFVGVCCPSADVLVAYATLTGLLIIIPLLVIIIYVCDRPSMMVTATEFLRRHMNNYESIGSGTTSSILMGVFMAGFQCCGFENGSDFHNNGSKFTGNDSIGGEFIENIMYPVPCCMPAPPEPETTTVTTSQTTAAAKSAPPAIPTPGPDGSYPCPLNFTTNNSYIDSGCKKILTQQLVAITDIVAFSSLIPMFINVILLALTIVLIINFRQVLIA